MDLFHFSVTLMLLIPQRRVPKKSTDAKTRALRTLVGVRLSLDPEGKEKGSWWHSTAELVLIARGNVIL